MKVLAFVKMLRPPSYKLLLYIFYLSRDIHYSLAKELKHAVFKCRLTRVPYPNCYETLN